MFLHNSFSLIFIAVTDGLMYLPKFYDKFLIMLSTVNLLCVSYIVLYSNVTSCLLENNIFVVLQQGIWNDKNSYEKCH